MSSKDAMKPLQEPSRDPTAGLQETAHAIEPPEVRLMNYYIVDDDERDADERARDEMVWQPGQLNLAEIRAFLRGESEDEYAMRVAAGGDAEEWGLEAESACSEGGSEDTTQLDGTGSEVSEPGEGSLEAKKAYSEGDGEETQLSAIGSGVSEAESWTLLDSLASPTDDSEVALLEATDSEVSEAESWTLLDSLASPTDDSEVPTLDATESEMTEPESWNPDERPESEASEPPFQRKTRKRHCCTTSTQPGNFPFRKAAASRRA
ncbi:hypothetical protein LTR08_006357 [Meristemomyces frigidus]|nr:hypothetical protein LTR08_006357 [Meristemomyces frigidus]